ncbi:MAG: GTP-binding protein [Promethearchaeota archaeon]
MSTKELLDELLENLVNAIEVEAAVVVDREGLVITSVMSKSVDEERVGAVTSMADSLVERIKNEFGTQENFLTTSALGDQKFLFTSAGPEAILTIVGGSVDDTTLQVYGSHVAKKVEQIIAGETNISLNLPPILEVISKFSGGRVPEGQYSTKVIVCGDFMVGKTSLIRRFVENKFQDDYISTIGVDITKKSIPIGEKTQVNFIIWDIAGQTSAQMAAYRKRFYNGANSALLVFDKTRASTLEATSRWLGDIKKAVPERIPIILVGNKSDLVDKVEVTTESAQQKADELGGFHLIETSAKTGENVEDAFRYLAYKVVGG